MIYKYEKACKDAGMSEEQIDEIRRFFDAEKKRLKRRRKAHDKCGFVFLSVQEMIDQYRGWDIETFDIPDMATDVEAEIFHKMDLERLDMFLMELSDDDREFLLTCFSHDDFTEVQLSEMLNMPRSTMRSRRERLVRLLKKRFEES